MWTKFKYGLIWAIPWRRTNASSSPRNGSSILPPAYASDVGAVSSAYVERAMKFLTLGDWFLVSALTGAVLLVEIGVLKVVGVI